MNKTLTHGALGMLALGLLVGCGSSLDEADPETKTFQLDGTTLSITTDWAVSRIPDTRSVGFVAQAAIAV